MTIGLGVDLGTSGVRVTVIKENGAIIEESKQAWTPSDGRQAKCWINSLKSTLNQCTNANCADRIAVSGTSGTLLAMIGAEVHREPMMYNDAITEGRAMQIIQDLAPAGHVVRSRSSALAKLLNWQLDRPIKKSERVAHQADYVAAHLCEQKPVSDWHNALKLGFDVNTLDWPPWLFEALDVAGVPHDVLPQVIEPGSVMGHITKNAAKMFNLREGASLVAGTTDSIAAFFACTHDLENLTPGVAVTSLGSTTALKLVSTIRVDDASTGVYSHRLDDKFWLVGGASNAGTRVLRSFDFDDKELHSLSTDKNLLSYADVDSDLYYPLIDKGERFPINDPNLLPRLPKNDNKDRKRLLANLLVSISRVEQLGYKALADLGASTLTSVATAGGGAANEPWRHFRAQQLGVPVVQAQQTDAAYGAAVLALRKL